MVIKHKIDDFLYTLFPEVKNNDNTTLLTKLQEYYTYGIYKPKIKIEDDKEPAEEYELVANWADDLKLSKYFELEGEEQYRRRSDFDSILESIENDPLGVNEKDPIKEREMKKFLNSQKEIGTNMAVVMFMVDALKYFEGMPKEQIKKIALEIAMQGTQGYKKDKKDYRIDSIPDKTFSGYHILAYYYVSFAITLPDMLSELQLPYEEEYKIALTLKE